MAACLRPRLQAAAVCLLLFFFLPWFSLFSVEILKRLSQGGWIAWIPVVEGFNPSLPPSLDVSMHGTSCFSQKEVLCEPGAGVWDPLGLTHCRSL